MDTLSHALWGGVAFGRKSRKSFLLASTFGLAPDILSFGILFASNLLGFTERVSFDTVLNFFPHLFYGRCLITSLMECLGEHLGCSFQTWLCYSSSIYIFLYTKKRKPKKNIT